MNDLSEIKPGDKLFVQGGYGKGHIETVERVTPTGRVITQSYQYELNGRRRGDTGWRRSVARRATDDDLAGIFRSGLVHKCESFRGWEKMSAEDLKTAADLVAKYQLPNQ